MQMVRFRSDLWGQLMPIVGRDWSHPGVAALFSNIRQSDYRILYLTARAIGQADSTRDYLFGLTQNQHSKLPGEYMHIHTFTHTFTCMHTLVYEHICRRAIDFVA